MAARLASLGYRGHYTGVDIGNRFQQPDPSSPIKVLFIRDDVHHAVPANAVDLLISVSALEHIDQDAQLLFRLGQHVATGGIELHFVPAPASLLTYLWHGYRQYTPASITARLGSSVEIVRLGGLGTFLVHMLTITIPEFMFHFRFRRSFPNAYVSLVLFGLAVDRSLPFTPTTLAAIRRH
jgi:hypothetical protein